jgi:hypothetical protein
LSNPTGFLDFRAEITAHFFRKSDCHDLACELLSFSTMSSLDSTCKKMAASPEHGGAGHLHGLAAQKFEFDPARHIAPAVAHELNNVLTVVQGFSDCLLLQHGEDAELQPQLKRISEASKRAATIIRDAMPKM